MRRIIKPFTVEVKNGGRKSAQLAKPVWPHDIEQPDVEWPGILLPVEIEHEPPKPIGRVLPDLNETADPVKAEREKLSASDSVLEPKRVTKREAVDDPRREPVNEMVDYPAIKTISPPIDVGAVTATIVLRRGPTRLSRNHFARSERWKARLPAAVHRKRK